MASLTIAVVLQAAAFGAAPESDYKEAYKHSQESGKPLVVLVGADWCPGCVKMKTGVIPEMRRRGLLRRFAFARINCDHQEKLARTMMTGETIPQLILYHKTDKGWQRQNLTGTKTADDVEAFLEKGLASANVAATETSVTK